MKLFFKQIYENNSTFRESFKLPSNFECLVDLGVSGKIPCPLNDPVSSAFPLKLPAQWIMRKVTSQTNTLTKPSSNAINENRLFLNVGLRLLSHDAFSEVNQAIIQIQKDITSNAENPNPPFIFIALPSFSGKTELVISLDFFATYKVWKANVLESQHSPLYTVVLSFDSSPSSGCGNSQDIYKSMTASRTLISLVTEDFETLKKDSKMITGSSLKERNNVPFKSLGFFVRLIELVKCGHDLLNTTEVVFSPLTVKEACAEIAGHKLDGKPIIACLDEFNTGLNSSEVDKNIGYLIRNLLREVGIVVIVCGTDSNAWNLLHVPPSNVSRISPSTLPWVYLIRALPPAFSDSIKAAIGTASDIEQLLKSSNIEGFNFILDWLFRTIGWDNNGHQMAVSSKPGFIVIFIQTFMKILQSSTAPSSLVGLLDMSLNNSLRSIIDRKDFLADKFGRFGQYFILFAAFRDEPGNEPENVRIHPQECVHRHFASLKLCDPSGLFKSQDDANVVPLYRVGTRTNLCFSPDGEEIQLRSKYLPYAHDELTFMMLTSTGRVRPFTESTTSCIFDLFKSDIYKLNMHASLKMQVLPRCGDFLEHIAIACTIVSTHHSLAGLTLENFLKALIFELLPKGSKFSRLEGDLFVRGLSGVDFVSFDDVPQMIKSARVPYLPPVNATATAALRKIPGVITGTISQPFDAEEVDGIIIPDIVRDLRLHRDELLLQSASTIGKEKVSPEIVIASLARNALLHVPEERLLGLLIECKNYYEKIDKSVLEKVIEKMLWKASQQISEGYLDHWAGLFFVSRLADITSSSRRTLRSKFPNLRVHVVRRSEASNHSISRPFEVIDFISKFEPESKTQKTRLGLHCGLSFHLFIIEVEVIYGSPLDRYAL